MPLPSLKSLRAAAEQQPEPLKLMTVTRGGLGNLLFPWLATEALAEDLRATGREVTTSYLSGTPQEKRPDISEYQMFMTSQLFEKMDIPRNATLHTQISFIYNPFVAP